MEQTLSPVAAETTTAVVRPFSFNTLRIATQIRELINQGVTLKNTLKEMNEVWLSLHTADQKCPIVEQTASRVKHQLVNTYAIKLIKYMNSIVGLDMVPLSQQDPEAGTWKMDAIILNISCNKVESHEHLFRLFLVNLYGLNETFVDYALNPSTAGIREYVKKTYDLDLGETEGVVANVSLEQAQAAIDAYMEHPEGGYTLY